MSGAVSVVLAAGLIAAALGFRLSGIHTAVPLPSPGEQEISAWCRSSDGPDGSARVGEAWASLGYGVPSDDEPSESDPGWTAACNLAFELWGLLPSEWAWCSAEANRDAFVRPAISLLGLGKGEANNADTLAEAPGDDLAEYTQACRFAYASNGGMSPPMTVNDFLALDPGTTEACSANLADRTAAAFILGVDAEEDGAGPTGRLAHKRMCRVASIMRSAPPPLAAPAPAPTPLPDQIVFEALIVNQTPENLLLADKTPAGLQEHLLRGCSSVRINGEQRLLPWELTYRNAAIAQGPKSLLKRLDRSDGTTRVGLEIVFEADGTLSMTETLPVGDLPSETCPEEAP